MIKNRDIFTIFSKVRYESPYSGAQGEMLKTQSNKVSINWQVIKYRNPFHGMREYKPKWPYLIESSEAATESISLKYVFFSKLTI